MNGSCHIQISHVQSIICDMTHPPGGSCLEAIRMCLLTYQWVMSHINESCTIWMGHVTYRWVMCVDLEDLVWKQFEWVFSPINESCHIWMSHVTYKWVMYHMNGSCHTWTIHVTYEWVMSHTDWSCAVTWGSCLEAIRISFLTYQWVMSRINESCHM